MNNLTYSVIISLAALTGAIWYAFQAGMLILTIQPMTTYAPGASDKKTILISWYTPVEKVQEHIDIVWSSKVHDALKTVITSWLVFMQEEGCASQAVTLEHIALNLSGNELFISFSASPFNQYDSIIKKWKLIESLFATVTPLFEQITHIRVMVKSKTLDDIDIDFSISLPLLSHLQMENPSSIKIDQEKQDLLIVIHPQGDKEHTGDIICQEFERTYTRSLAEAIKDMVEKRSNNKVIITHDIGQMTDQEQCATLANCLNAYIYIHLTCFETKGAVPELSCYFPLYHPATDFWVKRREPLALTPIHSAYIQNINRSRTFGMILSETLKDTHNQYLLVHSCYGLPLKAFIGISVPSLVIECGLPHSGHNQMIAEALAEAFNRINAP